jgi:hypothetical protein
MDEEGDLTITDIDTAADSQSASLPPNISSQHDAAVQEHQESTIIELEDESSQDIIDVDQSQAELSHEQDQMQSLVPPVQVPKFYSPVSKHTRGQTLKKDRTSEDTPMAGAEDKDKDVEMS